jgi:hypothetical protein
MNSSANQYSLLSFRSVSPARLSFVAARPVRMRLDIISDPIAFPKNMPSMDRVRQGAKRHPAGVHSISHNRKTDAWTHLLFDDRHRRYAPLSIGIWCINPLHRTHAGSAM